VRLLLARGAAVDARANDGSTSLIMASDRGHLDVVRELLARGADVNARRNDGSTPLMGACDSGHLASATLLLDAGADLALLNSGGWSALRYAKDRVERDNEESEEGAEPPTAAQRREHKALVALLKQRGAA
jgi:ankyrin repeat protein